MGKNILRFNLFESEGTDEVMDELNDNLSSINDILGQPKISKHKYTESTFVYIFTWELNLNISYDNDIDKLVEFNAVMKEIIDISATKQRMENFDFKVKILDKIVLTVYPKIKTNKTSYNFIFGQKSREIQIDTVELMRFFRDNGANILDIEERYEEMAEMGSLIIELDSDICSHKFVELFNDEVDKGLKSDVIDRSVDASSYKNRISINPNDEKTYVVKR